MTEQQDAATGAAERDDNVTPIRDDVERTASLEIVPGQKWWTGPQQAALESIGLADCPDADRMAFLHLCQSTGLDPFRREIYLLGRKAKVNNQWTVRWTPQTGIDGFRHLAEETGVYGGRVGPQWAGAGGRWVDVWLDPEPPRAARCGVIRTDRPSRCRQCGGDPGGDAHGVDGSLRDGQHVFDDERITWAVALYDEYVPLEDEYAGDGDRRQKTGNKIPTSMWRKMGANQLAKCAEAAAIRAAFPRRAAGLYEHAEMDAATQAAREVEESERDRQRRELPSRPWAAAPGGDRGVLLDPASAGDAAPSKRAEPSLDRTVLLAELAEQAQAAGKTIAQYAVRWVAAHRKNIEEATDAELEAFLAARRGDVAAPVAPGREEVGGDHGMTVEEIARPPAAPDDVASERDDGSREPGEGQQALLDGDPAGDLPIHQFEPTQDDPETCAFGCGMDAGDPVHFG